MISNIVLLMNVSKLHNYLYQVIITFEKFINGILCWVLYSFIFYMFVVPYDYMTLL